VKCELCGKQYVALGVHVRRKHGVSTEEYREDFGLLKTMPLLDEDMSRHLSMAAKRRLMDAEYKSELQSQCRGLAAKNVGKDGPVMSQAGRELLAKRNTYRNIEYLKGNSKQVAKILAEKKTILDVRRDIGMGAAAVKRILAMGAANYSKEVALEVGTQRRTASRLANKRPA